MRLVSAPDAVAVVRSGDRVYLHCEAATRSVRPRALGVQVHDRHIDMAIEVDVPPHVHANPTIGEINDGSASTSPSSSRTGRPSSSASGRSRLRPPWHSPTKKDLGIHTEMFTDAVVDLVEAGVVTGAAKERNRGKIVTTFLMGSPRLYAFVHDNPMVEMRAVDFTNDTHVIRSFSRMVSINSAIEVDLTGQVVADSIGHTVYSGVGGQMDFIRGRRRHRRVDRSSPCRRRP